MTSFVGKAVPAPVLRHVVGEDLFAIAAHHLGDASQWYRIAQLNKLTDPWITAPVDLRLPNRIKAGNGGILGG